MTQTTSLIPRCPHGIYTAGAETSLYCTACNPEPRRVPSMKRRIYKHWNHPAELDCVQFIEQPVGARMSVLGEA